MTLLILFLEVTHCMPALCKQQVTNTGPKAHSQEQPAIEGHNYQHEQVAITNLYHM